MDSSETASSGTASSGVGTVLGGRYEIAERIGAGGMGVVWSAWDHRLRRRVAVKQLESSRGEAKRVGVACRRAPREARVGARVMHPKVIAVYDVVECDQATYLVMEYLPSRSLAAVLTAHGPLDPPMVAHIGVQIAEALHAIHDAGVVHGDVKPGNVLLTDCGMAKLTDFGGSRGSWEAIDAHEPVVGTPGYVAPEVARGAEPSQASDVFSLGATLYAALENEPVCGRQHTVSGALRAMAGARLRPATRAGVLRDPLTAMLRADAARRPSAAAVRRLLERHSDPTPLPARRTPVSTSPSPPSSATTSLTTRSSTEEEQMDQPQSFAEPCPGPVRPDLAREDPSVHPRSSEPGEESFKIVTRGYDRTQVQDRIREIVEAAALDRRHARESREELATIQAQLDALRTARRSAPSGASSGEPPSASGSATSADLVLRFADQQATELLDRARHEAAARRERAAADADALRRQAEEDLRERADDLDQRTAERRTALDQREHDLAELLTTRTAEGARVTEAAERDAAARRARVEQRIEEILEAGRWVASQTRARAEAERSELASVREQLRHHLEAVHRLLGDQPIHVPAPRSECLPGSSAPGAARDDSKDTGKDTPAETSPETPRRDDPAPASI
jgi:serine/threonine protein kinase